MILGVPDYDAASAAAIGGPEDGEESRLSHVSLLEQLDTNQTSSAAQSSGEDADSWASKSNKSGYQFASGLGNSYYELILHKMMHFNVRKYPDEIITRNVILKGSTTVPSSVLTLRHVLFGLKKTVSGAAPPR